MDYMKIANKTPEEELFCLFGAIKNRITKQRKNKTKDSWEKQDLNYKVIATDKEIFEAIKQLKKTAKKEEKNKKNKKKGVMK